MTAPGGEAAIYRIQGGTNCRRDRLCPTCHQPLPKERHHTYCSACAAAYKRALAQNPNRRCCSCPAKLPVGRLSARCADCDRAASRARFEARKSMERSCIHCPARIPAGRASDLCPPCLAAKTRAWKRRRTVCPCGDPAPKPYTIYCNYCERERQYDDRHKGAPRGESGGATGSHGVQKD